jgi:hypothetical protein
MSITVSYIESFKILLNTGEYQKKLYKCLCGYYKGINNQPNLENNKNMGFCGFYFDLPLLTPLIL